MVAGWISPALIALSVVLLGRSFYVLYVHKRGTVPVKVLTWFAAVFVIGFWTWRFVMLAGCETEPASTPADAVSSTPEKAVAAPLDNPGRVKLHVKDMCKRLKIS